ncbi:RF-PROK-I domain-containing protein [Mycena venus]|uniref:RF-PROK-I domain-containing protein n=1 Tax=Mycena venus TaxID=2733690 RepID=A0A8H7CJF0_9AGAR|nr:RF-PROK-I domain-containing protein [Mycena venus]
MFRLGLRRFSSAIQQIEKDGARILRIVKKRVDERAAIASQISETMASPEDIMRLKQLKETEPIQEAWDQWVSTREALRETQVLLDDPDLRSMAAADYTMLTESLTEIVKTKFPAILVPPSRTTHLSALMELKSGVGGSEASLFLGEMLRMYLRLAQVSRWKANIVSSSDLDSGGMRDAVVEFKGAGAYDALRWESGVHRVQRVPATEQSGRVHTSTVAVVVLPLVEESEAQKEELYSMDDIKIEVMRARGAGGQHVNKTESAVRLTHIPSGVTVAMQDERSQHQNKRRAFQVLASRLLEAKLQREMEERRASRRNLVKSADRSDKIRTYNYAQERVTDHRIGLSLMNLSSVMEGDGLQDFVAALQRDHEESQMEDMLLEE